MNKTLNNDLERFSYALGMSVASNLIKSGVEEIDPNVFIEAMKDTFAGSLPQMLPDEANKILETFMSKAGQGKSEANLKEGQEFLQSNKNKKGVIELPSGLQYEMIKEGEGEMPTINDTVKCHYHGTLVDGTIFDSSVERGQPAEFPVNAVIPGWTEALQLMSEGSKWKLYLPPHLAYGEQGAGGVIEPNSTLIFEVELIEIV